MGKYQGSSRSFNTLKHSNRAERSKRRVQSKYLILSICAVIIAILLALMVFAVMAIAHKGSSKAPAETSGDKEIAFKEATFASEDAGKGNLLLVNAQHKYSFFEGTSLVSASSVSTPGCVQNSSILVNAEALAAYDSMMKKYVEVFGESDIWLVEAYRTEAEQANKQFAPGYSDHHTGRLLTIKQKNGSDLSADNWLYQNCYKYGFVVRYPETKSMQTGVSGYTYAFRYVGIPHATYMQEHSLCMEEYIVLLQNNYSSGETLKFTAADGNRYAVYSVKAATSGATTLSVPSALPYTISGDNAGSFVITVTLGKAE
ncbi:MAG: D-alanyl-D-alanine carboxypeptidase family protein [Clostridia bacterium]|nr:D-alanyl-D-alanine carboxypeptidase family protein [Clostridia bacterium]